MDMKFLFLLGVVALATEINLKDRMEGLLFGLAAGEKNGGPIRMAVRLCESIIENGGTYDQTASWNKMANWMRGPPHDVDKAFDTGITFEMLWDKTENLGMNPVNAAKAVCEERELNDGRPPIGINPAHRGIVLALLPQKFTTEEIKDICHQENALTHYHKGSEECLYLSVMLARFLILGETWEESFQRVQGITFETPEIRDGNLFDFDGIDSLSKSRFGPDVMRAALYFVHNSNNFDEAIDNSVPFADVEEEKFAGNMCPVIVGALAGARWGKSHIADRHFTADPSKHVPKEYQQRLSDAAEGLFKLWNLN